MCAELQIEKVFFIHVENSPEVPVELRQNLQRKNLSPEEGLRQMIASKTGPVFEQLPNVETEILIEEGTPLKELLV